MTIREPVRRVGVAICAVAAVAACTTTTEGHPTPLDQPPTTTESGLPEPRPEPPLRPGIHPVVVHNCDYDGGYEVTEKRNPDAGAEVDVHDIEVYQTRSDHSIDHHPLGAADVYVHNTTRPQVLVLSAYEPTLWRVHSDPGVRIPLVVLNSGENDVSGVPDDIEVVTENNWSALPDRRLAELADKPRTSETYCYDASLFSIRP
ncbi:hypothetical protein GV794_06380 [Nocardia cyriacigeorgica]|uniref:Uncharacterized protein n=1 Tax=Nocardia cyriacigeorgica TaxID=135487 RepID=A0A6P1D9H1_9NOCA|nr:hypothetical protein [Nocardia cyriacigeorgica]NEW40981.1 hypothetical protein [Nocardia cyriacigeorgica]NEW47345.1 hypothetical protein [Nocardia cyriacigeorgica]NEW51213.1 hypothetical protein [Nocardia cyriacigeorgica]NEW55283.1 hypothetical protein [Nocardia cyriacigeorgica]